MTRVLVDPETGELVETTDAEVVSGEPWDLATARRVGNGLHVARVKAETAFREASKEKAAAQSDYRRLKARAILRVKADHGATVAPDLAAGEPEVVAAYERRIIAEGMERAALERLRLCSEDRATFHRIVDWSKDTERFTGGQGA